jgi:hypothetical protein
MEVSMVRKHFKLLLMLTLVLFAGCYGGNIDEPTSESGYSTYDINLDSKAYSSAVVYYPTTKDNYEKYAAISLTGGFTNVKEDFDWLSQALVKQKLIVIAFTPTNILGEPPVWQTGHNGALAMLKTLNNRPGCPIAGKVDTGKLGIIGFSKGGGGALMAANDNVSGAKAVVAMSPWMWGTILQPTYGDTATDSNSEATKNIKIPAYIYTGNLDELAWPQGTKAMYKGIPLSTKKMYIMWRGIDHLEQFGDWEGDTKVQADRDHLVLYINAWFQLYLYNDTSYQTYIDGAEQAENLDANWFCTYAIGKKLYDGDCEGCW